jgi:DNA processing protein
VSDDKTLVTQLLGPAPVSIDDLARQSGLPIRTIHMALLELELAGRIERHGGNAVSIVEVAQHRRDATAP